MKPILHKAWRILSGYELSCILFVLLFILTYLGTVTQVEQGLYQAQKKYFESFVLVHHLGGVLPLPLPGAYPVLALLFVNLLFGGIVRVRKSASKLGILTAHAGILVLLAGAFVSYQFTQSGHVTLYEGETADAFQSYHDWEIGVAELRKDGPGVEYVIPPEFFRHLRERDSRTFTFAQLPFDLILSGYAENALVQDNTLQSRPVNPAPELNVAGARVSLREKDGSKTHEGILWAGSRAPLEFTVAGGTYRIEMRRRAWPLPFSVTLKKFTRELHPRTNLPKEFRSDVIRTENGVEQPHRITMNEPMRYRGYTFYQSSWGPENARPGDRLYSTLAVVKNPAEQCPIAACVMVTAGLLLHFALKLTAYLRAATEARP